MTRNIKQPKIEQISLSVTHKPSVKIELITPEVAEKMLKKNPENRKLQPLLSARYSKDMEQGRWKFNNSTIGLCIDGTLMDGQHRLSAIVKTGLSAEMIVVRNLERDAFSTIDIGKKRNLSDFLAIRGYQYTTRLSGALRLISMFAQEKEVLLHAMKSRTNASLDELFDMMQNIPELQVECTHVISKYPTLIKYIGASCAIALFHLFKKKDEALALELFDALNTGHMLDMNSTIYQCRDLLIKHRMESDLGRYRNAGATLYLIVRTWNLMRNGTRDIRLVDANKSPIPVIV